MKISKGFTLIEGLVILVIVGVLAGAGWYVWNNHKKTTTTTASTSQNGSSSANSTKYVQTTEMKTGTIPKTSITFQYPANWTYDVQNWNFYSANNYMVTMTSTSNHSGDWLDMEIYFDERNVTNHCGSYCTVISASNITLNSKPAKLIEVSSIENCDTQCADWSAQVFQMFASDSTSITAKQTDVKSDINLSSGHLTTYTKFWRGSDQNQMNLRMTQSDFNAKPEIADAKKVISSIKY